MMLVMTVACVSVHLERSHRTGAASHSFGSLPRTKLSNKTTATTGGSRRGGGGGGGGGSVLLLLVVATKSVEHTGHHPPSALHVRSIRGVLLVRAHPHLGRLWSAHSTQLVC